MEKTHMHKFKRVALDAQKDYEAGVGRLTQVKQERNAAINRHAGLEGESEAAEVASFASGGRADAALEKRLLAAAKEVGSLERQVSVGERAVAELFAKFDEARRMLESRQHEIAAAEVVPIAAAMMAAIDRVYECADAYIAVTQKHQGFRPSVEQVYGAKVAPWDELNAASQILEAACGRARVRLARANAQATREAKNGAAGTLGSLSGALVSIFS